MPGLRSASLKIWTFPALGRTGAGSWPKRKEQHAAATASAANFCMGTILVTDAGTPCWLPFIIVQIFKERESGMQKLGRITFADRYRPDCSRRRGLDRVRRAAADVMGHVVARPHLR